MNAIVLLYHRVTHLQTDPQLLAVTPEHFADQMKVLRQVSQVVPLSQIVDGTGVAVTFDDGYADNLHEAAPVLGKFEVPAIVFATTGHTDSTDEFFWDELDCLFLQPNLLPEKLELGKWAFDLKDCSQYTTARWQQQRSWNVLQSVLPGSRQELYLAVCKLLHGSTVDQRAAHLSYLREWSNLPGKGRESHRMMTSVELGKLAASGVVEVGAHTVNHPLLAAETPQRQREEIQDCKASLEKILGKPVGSFSYPFGTRRDYNSITMDAVRSTGFEMACSNFEGTVTAVTDRLQIPRFIVRDWDGPEFTRRLCGWLGRP